MPDEESPAQASPAVQPGGPLQPIELATAAVLALPAVMLTVVGWFLPHLTVIAATAVVPLAVVAYRHRVRALVASGFAAFVLSGLVAGTGAAANIVECAAIGGLVGVARRRKWSFVVVPAGAIVMGAVLSAVSVGLLIAFSSIRKLTLEQISTISNGVRRVLLVLSFGGRDPLPLSELQHLAQHYWWLLPLVMVFALLVLAALLPVLAVYPVTDLMHWMAGSVHAVGNGLVRDWWMAVILSVVASAIGYALVGWFLLGPVVNRLQWLAPANQLEIVAGDEEPGPLPILVKDVSYRYAGSTVDALSHLTVEIPDGELVAVVGNNGSGKSTLARILAGQKPTSGEVIRPGSAGLGRPGGTAMIMQHPETQVLGVRVADDVVWGLPDGADADVPGLLRAVGLEGFENRETSGLSGGELQRLAVAAALARRPRLLISDESTAMVDEEGRRVLIDLFEDVKNERGIGVVHVTHRTIETAGAGARITMGSDRPVEPSPVTESGADEVAEETRPLELIGVSHIYGVGTPWAQPALRNINLVVDPGDGLLIVGGNGSGKSTLASIMAGLLRPIEGACLLGGVPVLEQIGSVGLAFQQARLQLQRPEVGADIKAAGAPDDEAVQVALAAVGLPADFAGRRIEQLSGGQQRRVAIAGLLARRPSVLVLDEPLAGLDQPTREGLLSVLAGLRHHRGVTVVIISHDLTGVEQVCDRTLILESGSMRNPAVEVVR